MMSRTIQVFLHSRWNLEYNRACELVPLGSSGRGDARAPELPAAWAAAVQLVPPCGVSFPAPAPTGGGQAPRRWALSLQVTAAAASVPVESHRVIMAARRTVRGYAPLPTENRHDNSLNDDVDLQFAYTPKSFRKIPWKSIALALFLLLLGSSLLSLSYFIFTGHIEGDNSQAYGLLFLGILAFLPGFYETRVAYYSWRGAPGYTFASIPDY
ncbi:uncharacterized protein LOC102712329 [Oryza brachyantha]|uniref:uncharacterized protein LOC102712329 n=1 Tax=Oryza brachyantha TaxID=4533 RepID=UPI001ADCC11B|nr:uncharacterized protein LOC102712329 [Oryza brachyantha]